MTGLRRYSDFKTLRAALVEAVEAQRRTAGPGSRSSLEGGDILSLARSRRSSSADDSSSGRESLLLNARDSLCAEDWRLSVGGFGVGGRLSVSEQVPPLPSRQIMSMR